MSVDPSEATEGFKRALTALMALLVVKIKVLSLIISCAFDSSELMNSWSRGTQHGSEADPAQLMFQA